MKRTGISVTIILMVLGVLLTTSFFTKQRSVKTSPLSRKKDLIKVVRDLEQKRERLKGELNELRADLNKHEKRAASEQGVLSSFTDELEDLRTKAGFTRVRGRGLEVVLADSPAVPIDEDANNYIIHDYDLRALINALWSSGAKAVAVNNQRLVSTSAVRCVGTTILANLVRLGSPYTIRAVGNPEVLEEGLAKDRHASRLLNEYAEAFGLKITVDQISEIKLPPYEGSLKVEHAKYVEE